MGFVVGKNKRNFHYYSFMSIFCFLCVSFDQLGQLNQRASKQIYPFSMSKREYYFAIPTTFTYAFNLFDDGFVSISKRTCNMLIQCTTPSDIMNGIKNSAFRNKAVIYVDEQMHKIYASAIK